MRAKKPSKTSRKRPKKEGRPFPVVGIGASAGGLGPLQSFFRAVQAGSGSAFVVVQHLHPDHPSLTAELLGKCTSLPVTEATDRIELEPNHVYTIPPNRIPTIRNGAIHLTRPTDRSANRTPIDDLFRSLAADREERGVGIVLSGSGTDGTEGVRALHAAGGLVIVQDPKTAQFDSMPQSAIAAGDFGIVLPVEKMPDAVRRYARHPYMRHAPKALSTTEEGDLDAVLSLVQERLGLQLREYKKGPLARRIHRRMGLRHVERLDDYAALLAGDKAEMAALGRDLLITVSEFFRDPPAWEALERDVVAPLVAARAPDEPIRVWVAGTATGEEAYSLAIMLFEKIDAAKKRCPLQIFATDVSQTALTVARNGAYAAGIATRVAPLRLRRFFEATSGDEGYRVSQRLRSAVTFAPHDLLRDPPFLNLDLVSCRNLLIYLEPKTQEKVLAMFHFALRPNGYFFLGSAESEGTCRDLFAPISKKWRIYRRIGTGKGHPVTFSTARRGQPPQPVSRPASAVGGAIATDVVQRAILDRVAPPSAVVDRRGEVLYLWGDVDRYLALPRGVPTRDILSMVRPAFRARLRRALRQAAHHASTVTVEAVPIEGDGASGRIRVRVHPLTGESETEAVSSSRSARAKRPLLCRCDVAARTPGTRSYAIWRRSSKRRSENSRGRAHTSTAPRSSPAPRTRSSSRSTRSSAMTFEAYLAVKGFARTIPKRARSRL